MIETFIEFAVQDICSFQAIFFGRNLKNISYSVTRLGDLLHFGEIFKVLGNNYLAQITDILGIFLKVSKSFIFLVK